MRKNGRGDEKMLTASPEAEKGFREYIGYGSTTLPVLYRGNIRQLCRTEGHYVLVRADGYDGDRLDMLPGNAGTLPADAGVRGIRIEAGSVKEITASGQYADYVTLSGASVTLRCKSGKREKTLRLAVMGDVNEFVLREFFKDTGREMRLVRSGAAGKSSALDAILTHFNRKCRRLNRLMILTAALSCLLLLADALYFAPYSKILTGIGALLPLANFFLYLKYPKLISFLAPSVQNKTPYTSRKYAGFYSKFGIPMVMGMFCAFSGRSIVTQAGRLFLYGGILFAAMITLMAIFAREQRYKTMIAVGAAVLMLAYPVQTVHFVNRMAATEDYGTFTATVEKYLVNPASGTDSAEFVGITTRDGEPHELPFGFSENDSVIPGSSTVTVHEYLGLLGIRCADISLNN